ncbi:MAG: M16 family metallopeptidase [Pyrinomonadaceae bacterium]
MLPSLSKIFVIRPVLIGTICLCGTLSTSATAQIPAEPQREQLLNGLRVLFWPRPGGPEVLLKLRIHSGAAFDLAGKSGEMALLGDLLFPDRATIDYFTEEAGGKLEVAVNYDSVTLTVAGKASDLDRIVGVLRNALLAMSFTPDVVGRLRDARIKIIRDTEISPTTVADQAIKSRLFGNFPYGRPAAGIAEDLAKVSRGDLILARDRFFNANNATIAITGGFDPSRAMRTLRQLLGPWRRSDELVPTTFRQPEAPDNKILLVNSPGSSAEVRLAVRGVARSDPDYFTAQVLAAVTQHRWLQIAPDLGKKPVFVRSESYYLPGIFSLGATVDNQSAAATVASARKVLASFVNTPVTVPELESARAEVAAEMARVLAKPEGVSDAYLDIDTYNVAPLSGQMSALNRVSVADLQRVATGLFRDSSVAGVVVGEAAVLKSTLTGKINFEVMGETDYSTPAAKPSQKSADTKKPG